MTNTLWKTKLAARIHDPAEKALVLLRDPVGHEGGSIVQIGKELGFETYWEKQRDESKVEKLQLPSEIEKIIKKADHWAAAADRPQFPKDTNERFPDWAQVRFADNGEIRHPLSDERYDVQNIGHDVLAEHIKTVSASLFKDLIHLQDGTPDYYRTLLAFWRFAPECGMKLKGIGHLWSLLPADTRVPDHTIWQHIDLTSALAGAMSAGGRPALLTVSLGPVQDFIAAGRSTSDLWAGSHFLSTMAWQAMKVVAEAFGPDAIIFPQLRGVPVVDLWLIEQKVRRELFIKEYPCKWNDSATDYNPFFAAALPNKFVAVVPEGDGERLADEIKKTVRTWVQAEARVMLNRALKEINESPNNQYCYSQIEAQLREFPEVHWTLVPWLESDSIESALKAFHPGNARPAFFEAVWSQLREPIEIEQKPGWKFYEPNDGILYPAVHDIGERLLATTKSVRTFAQLEQRGYRDSLTGEFEWLTLDKKQLDEGSPRKRADTLWARLAKERPSWVKEGEHLSAFGLIKRLWPIQYMEWLKEQGIQAEFKRYVVSTHVMALAPTMELMLKDTSIGNDPEDATKRLQAKNRLLNKILQFERDHYKLDPVALPRRLMRALHQANQNDQLMLRQLPALLDARRELGLEKEADGSSLDGDIEMVAGARPERYYALLLMDGDHVGAWLSGEKTLPFRKAFHSRTLEGLERYDNKRLRDYLNLARPSSPARHMAISSALNGFSLDLVRHVVEDLCLGKLLYSGGDDVMAMVCVRDLPMALWLLRMVYSGGMHSAGESFFAHDMKINSGFVQWNERLYRMMGKDATASVGAIIAHHMAPLGAVLRNLREAEKTAKTHGGRNAFSIRILKRSGGRRDLTLPWWLEGQKEDVIFPMDALESLRQAIAGDLSRRVAYHFVEMVGQFPYIDNPSEVKRLIALTLKKQFERKARVGTNLTLANAERVADVAVREALRRTGSRWDSERGAYHAYSVVQDLLFTAEFLAREGRSGSVANSSKQKKEIVHA